MSSNPEEAVSADAGEQQHQAPSDVVAEKRELTDEEVEERHRAWMAEHGRVYQDEAERERRLGVFRENLRYIQAHNFGGHSYTLGLNQFADLTDEEFGATYCGGLLLPTTRPPPPLDDDTNRAEQEEEEGGRSGDPALPLPPSEAR